MVYFYVKEELTISNKRFEGNFRVNLIIDRYFLIIKFYQSVPQIQVKSRSTKKMSPFCANSPSDTNFYDGNSYNAIFEVCSSLICKISS